MHDFRIQREQLAGRELVALVHRLDRDAPAQRVNHDEAGRAVRRQAGTRFERKQHHPERPFMKNRDLPVPLRALVRLAAQRLHRRDEIDAVLGARESLGWRGAESILGR